MAEAAAVTDLPSGFRCRLTQPDGQRKIGITDMRASLSPAQADNNDAKGQPRGSNAYDRGRDDEMHRQQAEHEGNQYRRHYGSGLGSGRIVIANLIQRRPFTSNEGACSHG